MIRSFTRRLGIGARRLLLLTTAATIGFAAPAEACTSFLLGTTDGDFIYGRTMEFGFELKSSAIVVPRHFSFTATGAGGKPGRSWSGPYAAVGLNGFDVPVIIDGMNEKGLAGGMLYFPGYAGYADPAKTDPAKALAPWDFLSYALTQFATVAEVKAALPGIAIIDVANPALGFTPPLHYTLHDASGASIVIEPVGGELKVYDNPLGVMTNAPGFDWHLTNLKNYVKISPTNAPPLKIGGQTIASFGEGSGLIGVPGDPTPPSRFIRALGYVYSAEKRPAGDQSIRLAEHILNNFDIPRGWIRSQPGETAAEPLEYTQWSTVADLSARRFYIKTYDDPVLRVIDLARFDLDAKAIRALPMAPNMTPPEIVFPSP